MPSAATMPPALAADIAADIAALPVATRDRLARKLGILGEVMRRAALRFTADPARIMVAWEEGADRLSRFKTSARRSDDV